ncbi:MAG: hypothetical protein ACRC5T_01620 [Cetobacterium sp.]
MKKLLIITTILLSATLFTGCSAVMALSGDKDPNLSLIKEGQSRSIIESEPLKSVSTEKLPNGNFVSTYNYTVGKEPSAGRAIVYLLLDGLTFFLAELVTMPVEMSKKGDMKFIKIEYTPEGKVVNIF